MRVVYMELKFDPQYKSAVFRAKYLKREREWKTLPIACLQCFCRFYELLEAVLGDFLFNGRCDLASKPLRDKTADKTSHRIISPKTAPRSSEKRKRHSKHTTGKVLQTLVWCLGIFHGKLPIIFNRISAPYKPALILRFCDLCFVYCISYRSTIFRDFAIWTYILAFAGLKNSIDSRTSHESLEG